MLSIGNDPHQRWSMGCALIGVVASEAVLKVSELHSINIRK